MIANLLEKLEERLNKPYDQWNYEERETYMKWQKQLEGNKKELSIADIKSHIQTMLMALVKENSKAKVDRNTDIHQKARMANYLDLLDFMESPERAKKVIEAQIERIGGSK